MIVTTILRISSIEREQRRLAYNKGPAATQTKNRENFITRVPNGSFISEYLSRQKRVSASPWLDNVSTWIN